jgi:hypothetical protein
MEPMKKNKSRTAITIDPDLWQRCKEHCDWKTEFTKRKFSFSALVEEALKEYLLQLEPPRD